MIFRSLARGRAWLLGYLGLGLGLASCLGPSRVVGADAAEPWVAPLSRMPLGAHLTQLDRTNCIPLMLQAFQANDVVKALIFMPGATDEFYMFRRAEARLTNAEPSLLDAVVALTNQTLIHACFRPPFLLLHSDEDPLDPLIHLEYPGAVAKFKRAAFVPHALLIDQDWNYLQPLLKRCVKVEIRPWKASIDSFHFYRHSFAAWNLDGWEALQAAALAGKTTLTVRRRWDLIVPQTELIFEGDLRARAIPTFTGWPR